VQVRVLVCAGLLVLLAAGAAFADQDHVVQPGETLWAIAARHGISVESIARANNLADRDLLQPGQRLVIPSTAPPASAGAPAAPRYTTYTIKSGDTLWVLARRFAMSVEELAALNGIAPESTLRLGQVLKVEAGAAPATRTAPRAAALPETMLYRVRSGDTLWVLARRYDMTVARLAALNGLDVDRPLQIGQTLKVKALPRAVAAAPSTAASLRRAAMPPYRGAAWANSLIGLARRFIGTKYRWGATGPGAFDCSGFLQYIYARTGISLPRTTYYMFQTGKPVPAGALLPGDMVFFTTYRPGPSHAGIYLGDGMFIHSSSGYGSVTITPLSKEYYRRRYLGARRF
jgi:cell wall-associated NlpC family hydrolase